MKEYTTPNKPAHEKATAEQPTIDQRQGPGLRLLASIWPIAFYFILAVIMTYPLITDLEGSVIRHPVASRAVDVEDERWNLWWFKTAIVERHINPFYTDMLYYPYRQADNPLNLYYNDMHPLDMFIGMPVLLLTDPVTGPTLAYNLLTLGHLTLMGCAMFWLVRYLTGSTPGALVAGILYAFSSLSQYHIQAGHLVLLATGWLLLHLLFLHKFLYNESGGKRARLHGALAALFLLATSLTNWYLTVFVISIGSLIAIVRVLDKPIVWRTTLTRMTLVVVPWLALVSPLLLATIRASSDTTFLLVSGINYEVSLSLSPLDLITITKDARAQPAIWTPGTLGYMALLLGGIGMWQVRRRGLLWILLVVVGVVLALGPYLKWNNALEVSGTTGIPLPYYWFRELPYMSIARVPRRFIMLAHIGLSVLAGFGVAYIMVRIRQVASTFSGGSLRRLLPAATLALLVVAPLAEMATLPQPVAKVVIPRFFSEVASEKRDFGILELPVTAHYSQDHQRMFNQTVHHKKIIGGYLSRRVYDYYRAPDSPFRWLVDPPKKNEPDIIPPPHAFDVLNFHNIPYIIAYKEGSGYDKDWPVDQAYRKHVDAYLRTLYPDPESAIYEDSQLTAYRVPQASQSKPLIWVGSGWYPAEYDESKVWRWCKQQANIYVSTKTPLSISLSFSSQVLKGNASLEVLVNGKTEKRFQLSPVGTTFKIKNLKLAPGQSDITFRTDAKPITPVDAGISTTDKRELGFTVNDLKIDY